MARRPVFDKSRKTVGYRIVSSAQDGNERDLLELAQAIADLGVDRVLGSAACWLSPAGDDELDATVMPVPMDRVVLHAVARTPMVGQLSNLRSSGCSVAADWTVREAACRPADIVVVHNGADNADKVAEIRRMGRTAAVFGVDSQADFEACLALGFDLFSGQFFADASKLRVGRLESNQATLIELLRVLHAPEPDFTEVARRVEADPALTYRVLRVLQSTAFGGRRVDSIHQATVMLGVTQLRNLLTPMVCARRSGQTGELLTVALTRAKMCEMLAEAAPEMGAPKLYLVGLLSMIGPMLNLSPSAILAELPVDDDVRAAVVQRDGPAGALLSSVEAHERGDFEQCHFDSGAVSAAWLEAMTWADQIRQALA